VDIFVFCFFHALKIVHMTLNTVYPDILVFKSARLIMDGIGVGTP